VGFDHRAVREHERPTTLETSVRGPILTATASLALAFALVAPVAAADVELHTEPMSADDQAAIDAGVEALKSIAELIAERATGPLGLTGTALPPNEDTTLPEPVARGYMSPACIKELIAESPVSGSWPAHALEARATLDQIRQLDAADELVQAIESNETCQGLRDEE
jgi:hypothetical protein